jgi:hypothetical protein
MPHPKPPKIPKTYPTLCSSETEFRHKFAIYVRDMSIQGIAITAKRVGNLITCIETGKEWRILGESWKSL